MDLFDSLPNDSAGILQPSNSEGTKQPAELFWAVDVGGDGGKGCVIYDGVSHRKVSCLADCIKLASVCGVPTIKMERSFANYTEHSRQEIVDLGQKLGVALLTINPQQTAALRKRLGIEKTTDEVDAEMIYKLGLDEMVHFKQATVVCPEYKLWAKKLANEFMKMRRRGQAHLIADIVCGLIGKLAMQKHSKNLCGSDGKPSKPVIGAVAVAALATDNRRDFERLLGLYCNGHASIFRSNIFHWGWRPRRKREVTNLTSYRRSIRWLRSEVKKNSAAIEGLMQGEL
jgi:hypothetical protein